jgi:hypothetical protein
MTINKEIKSLGMPWEKEYGYAQAVKVGDTVYLDRVMTTRAKLSESEISRLRCARRILTFRSC